MTIWKGTRLSSPITFGDDAQVWPTHYSVLGAGGSQEVADITSRDAIPVDIKLHPDGMGSGRRRNLMLVSVSDKGDGNVQIYQLLINGYNELSDSDKLTALANNSNWTEGIANTGGTFVHPTIINPIINAAVGSDETDDTGDIYYRDAAGEFTRLGIGTEGQVLSVISGLPAWTDITLTSGPVYLRGDEATDNSVRIIIDGTDVNLQLKISGVWTVLSTIGGPV